MVPTYRLDIEYDGTDWHGWQSQPDDRTVQDSIEAALSTALRQPVSIVGSGRTDAGVHARGQVAHFVLEKAIDEARLFASVNGILPNSIAVRKIDQTYGSFHARYDARKRRYRYRICCIPIAIGRRYHWYVAPTPDINAMNQAADDLLGEHDFSTFCSSNSETKNRICSVFEARWHEADVMSSWFFEIIGNRFLHGMVRSIVGTLVEIGHGKRDVDSIPSLLKSEDRRNAGFSAPAEGLTLEEVVYE
ncbi:MAG: tRNA pseudouridine(38-40) synthase TruA [Rhodothermia bacterium]|nr:MAG: tRNA pseudouridine(38-40) synthase TruA [Rhodothermia bacterium]